MENEKKHPIGDLMSTTMEKIRLALSGRPSPRVLAISAPPPVPIIKPMEPMTMRKGMMRLTAAKGVLPTKLETKKPSTTL